MTLLLKWIVCHVDDDRRDAFSRAQSRWIEIASTPGLLAQVGGWDLDDPQQACVLALWSDASAHDCFMRQVHDPIAAGQAGTYRSCSVLLCETMISIEGSSSSTAQALLDAGALRVADCRVRAGAEQRFVEAQHSVWNPGMAAAGGLQGGLFSRASGEPRRFVVVTAWHDLAAHEAYVVDHFPALKRRAAASEQLDTIGRHRIQPEPAWRVAPA